MFPYLEFLKSKNPLFSKNGQHFQGNNNIYPMEESELPSRRLFCSLFILLLNGGGGLGRGMIPIIEIFGYNVPTALKNF